jgi:ribonuclease P protein component
VGDERLSERVAHVAVQGLRSKISHQFSSRYRLLRADGFGHVIRVGSVADNHFKICFTPNRQHHARLGIIASKKTIPGAVDRNRIKRVIREIFRQNTIKKHGFDLVVLVRCNLYKSQAVGTPIDYLKKLFSQVEKRCAD